jgi:autoinducer 2-degrading protein
MYIVHVYVHVKPEYLDAFKEITRDNARHSVQEPGIARFDVVQSLEEPTRFVLVEVYRDQDAPARHKETAHYNRWAEGVAHMLAEPRTRARFENIFPGDEGW